MWFTRRVVPAAFGLRGMTASGRLPAWQGPPTVLPTRTLMQLEGIQRPISLRESSNRVGGGTGQRTQIAPMQPAEISRALPPLGGPPSNEPFG